MIFILGLKALVIARSGATKHPGDRDSAAGAGSLDCFASARNDGELSPVIARSAATKRSAATSSAAGAGSLDCFASARNDGELPPVIARSAATKQSSLRGGSCHRAGALSPWTASLPLAMRLRPWERRPCQNVRRAE